MRKVHEQIILMNMKKCLLIQKIVAISELENQHTWVCFRFLNIHLEVLRNESDIRKYLCKTTKNGEGFLFLY